MEPYIKAFIEAVYPHGPELALACFNERRGIEDATGLLQYLESRNKQLQNQVAALQAEAAGLREKLRKVDELFIVAQEQGVRYMRERDRLQMDLQMANERLGELTQDREALKAECDRLRRNLIDEAAAHRRVIADRSRLHARVTELEGWIDRGESGLLAQVRDDNQRLRAEVEALEGGALHDQLVAQQQYIERLERVVAAAQGSHPEHHDKCMYCGPIRDALAALAPRRTGEGEEHGRS